MAATRKTTKTEATEAAETAETTEAPKATEATAAPETTTTIPARTPRSRPLTPTNADRGSIAADAAARRLPASRPLT